MAKDFSRRCIQSEISKASENFKKMIEKNQLLKRNYLNYNLRRYTVAIQNKT